MQTKMQVEAIRRGTVIDHIPAGLGLRIVNHLQLLDNKVRMTVGFNLMSGTGGLKDLIKVDDWLMTQAEASELALLAPGATVNVIDEFNVVSKFKMTLPKTLIGVFNCPNSNCISRNEPVKSHFHIRQDEMNVSLTCHYCEKRFAKDLVTTV